MADQKADVNVLALLEGTLEDLADLPEIKPYPKGAHKVKAKLEKVMDQKDKKKLRGFSLKLTAIETLELSDSADEPVQKDSKNSVLYLLDNEIGQGVFKKMFAGVADKIPGDTLGQKTAYWCENELECAVVTTQRKDKNDDEKIYTVINEITVL